MVSTYLKYFFYFLSFIFSVYSLIGLLEGSSWGKGMGQAMMMIIWGVFLGALLLLAGLFYFFGKSLFFWDVFKVTVGMGLIMLILYIPLDRYFEYRSSKRIEAQNARERAAKKAVIDAYKADPHNPKTLVDIGNQAPWDWMFHSYDKNPTNYFVEAIEIDPDYIPAYEGLFELIQNMRLRGDIESGFVDDKSIYPYMEKIYAEHMLAKADKGEISLSTEERKIFTDALTHAQEWLSHIEEVPKGQEENYRQDLRDATAQIEQNSTNALSWAQRAYVNIRWDRDIDQAEEDITRALSLNPNLYEVQKTYAYYLSHIRQCDASIEAYKKALEIDPEEGEHNALKYRIQECEEALAWAKKRVPSWNKEDDLYTLEFYYDYRRKMYKDYNKLYELKIKTVLEKDPNDIENLIKMGHFMKFIKNENREIVSDPGIIYFQKAIELKPDDVRAYMYLAAAYTATGEKEKRQSLLDTVWKKVDEGVLKLTHLQERFFRNIGKL